VQFVSCKELQFAASSFDRASDGGGLAEVVHVKAMSTAFPCPREETVVVTETPKRQTVSNEKQPHALSYSRAKQHETEDASDEC